ncbi:MAG: NADH-quinone oxidoreductase subunit NuoK [Alphaproteobacteria bacterium]
MPTALFLNIGLPHVLALSALLFVIGVLGIFINRKNIIIILMSLELILLAVNINFVAFGHFGHNITGQVFSFFIITIAAAELAIGLAIVTLFHRHHGSIDVDVANELKG